MDLRHKNLLSEMKNSIGKKDPIIYFDMMTDLFSLLFDKINDLEAEIAVLKTNTALSIKWEPKVASDLLSKQIEILRKDKDVYFDELSKLKQAYAEDKITQNYSDFCQFWVEVLGWHPFLTYSK